MTLPFESHAMPITLRPATLDDIPDITRIRTSVTENHMTVEQMAARGITEAGIAEMIEAAPCAWIAEVQGRPAGFAMIDRAGGSVFALFIDPAFEGRGLGARLLSIAESALFEHHDVIWLETGPETRAAAFYQRRGWSVTGMQDPRNARLEKPRPAERR